MWIKPVCLLAQQQFDAATIATGSMEADKWAREAVSGPCVLPGFRRCDEKLLD